MFSAYFVELRKKKKKKKKRRYRSRKKTPAFKETDFSYGEYCIYFPVIFMPCKIDYYIKWNMRLFHVILVRLSDFMVQIMNRIISTFHNCSNVNPKHAKLDLRIKFSKVILVDKLPRIILINIYWEWEN